MRVLMTIRMSTEKANKAVMAGTIGQTIGKFVEQAKPEAVYFGEQNGQRTAFMVVNLDGAHQIPVLCEPWFLEFDASITLTPVMVPADLMTAGPDFEQVAKAHGG